MTKSMWYAVVFIVVASINVGAAMRAGAWVVMLLAGLVAVDGVRRLNEYAAAMREERARQG